MFSDGKSNAAASATGQQVTSARPQPQDQKGLQGVGATRPPRLRNLAALLARENVEFVLVLAGTKSVRIGATLTRGGQDSKTLDVGDEGCIVILKLSDNPAGVGAGFFEIRQDESAMAPTQESK